MQSFALATDSEAFGGLSPFKLHTQARLHKSSGFRVSADKKLVKSGIHCCHPCFIVIRNMPVVSWFMHPGFLLSLGRGVYDGTGRTSETPNS